MDIKAHFRLGGRILLVPGSNDLLFADNTNIYRYKVADDTMTVIYTLAIAGHDWTRSLHIREAP